MHSIFIFIFHFSLFIFLIIIIIIFEVCHRDLCGFQSFFNFAIVVAALAHTNKQHASIKKMIANGRVDS